MFHFVYPVYLWLFVVFPIVYLVQHFWHSSKAHIVVPYLSLWTGTEASASARVDRLEMLRKAAVAALFFCTVLALANPYTGDVMDSQGRPMGQPLTFVIVLDNSLRMQVQEKRETRWQSACKLVADYAKIAPVTLVCTAPTARIVLEENLASLSPARQLTTSASTISLASQLLGSLQERLVIVTDGAGADWQKILSSKAFPDSTVVHIIGETSENIGLCLHEAYRTATGELTVGVEVTNYGNLPQQNELRWEGESHGGDREQQSEKRCLPLFVKASEKVYHRITLAGGREGKWRFFLSHPDALVLDDEATYRIHQAPKAKVLVITDRPQPYVVAALASYPELVDIMNSAVCDAASVPALANFDLVVVCSSFWPPATATNKFLFFGTEIPSLPAAEIAHADRHIFWRTNPSHPVMKNITFYDLQIDRFLKYNLTSRDTILVSGKSAGVIWESNYGDMKYIYVAFTLENSQFFLLPSFPIFMHNVMLWALGRMDNFSSEIITQNDAELSRIAPFASREQIVPGSFRKNRQSWRVTLVWFALILCVLIASLRFLSRVK